MSFYKTKRWKKKRANILRRDDYMCRECKRYGNTTSATTVHHIYPLEEYPKYRLTSINLISLCGDCHNGMHDRVTGKLTAKGKALKERMKHQIESCVSLL